MFVNGSEALRVTLPELSWLLLGNKNPDAVINCKVVVSIGAQSACASEIGLNVLGLSVISKVYCLGKVKGPPSIAQ